MPLTDAQAESLWRSESPRNPGESQADYDGRAAAGWPLVKAAREQQESDAARIALRKKWRAGKAITTAPVGTTPADVRQAVIQNRNVLDGLLDVLKDAGLVLDDVP